LAALCLPSPTLSVAAVTPSPVCVPPQRLPGHDVGCLSGGADSNETGYGACGSLYFVGCAAHHTQLRRRPPCVHDVCGRRWKECARRHLEGLAWATAAPARVHLTKTRVNQHIYRPFPQRRRDKKLTNRDTFDTAKSALLKSESIKARFQELSSLHEHVRSQVLAQCLVLL